MAGTNQRSVGETRRRERSYNQYQMNAYVDGNTVRKLQTAPKRENQARSAVSSATRKNREKALQMNMSYVLFLTVAAVVTVFVCINYLKLQAQNTAYQKTVTAKGVQLSEMKLENDSEYNRIVSSVDLEHVKDVAMNELGMVYASEKQIRTYNSIQSDYVKQYQDIPAE